MAGTVTFGAINQISKDRILVTAVCVGDSVDGSIPSTDFPLSVWPALVGYDLVQAYAFPTSGGTAPDEANVQIYDEDDYDLLEANGDALIHATLKKACTPKVGGTASSQPVNGQLTLTVTAQATASAEYTVEMVFER